MAYGFVYVLSNSIMPDIYKVGYTERSPIQRSIDLSNTSIPTPYEVLCYGELDFPAQLEHSLHDMYKRCRVTQNREFFKFDFEDLMSICYSIEESSVNFIECKELEMIKYRRNSINEN
jgi:hypothetical protein